MTTTQSSARSFERTFAPFFLMPEAHAMVSWAFRQSLLKELADLRTLPSCDIDMYNAASLLAQECDCVASLPADMKRAVESLTQALPMPTNREEKERLVGAFTKSVSLSLLEEIPELKGLIAGLNVKSNKKDWALRFRACTLFVWLGHYQSDEDLNHFVRTLYHLRMRYPGHFADPSSSTTRGRPKKQSESHTDSGSAPKGGSAEYKYSWSHLRRFVPDPPTQVLDSEAFRFVGKLLWTVLFRRIEFPQSTTDFQPNTHLLSDIARSCWDDVVLVDMSSGNCTECEPEAVYNGIIRLRAIVEDRDSGGTFISAITREECSTEWFEFIKACSSRASCAASHVRALLPSLRFGDTSTWPCCAKHQLNLDDGTRHFALRSLTSIIHQRRERSMASPLIPDPEGADLEITLSLQPIPGKAIVQDLDPTNEASYVFDVVEESLRANPEVVRISDSIGKATTMQDGKDSKPSADKRRTYWIALNSPESTDMVVTALVARLRTSEKESMVASHIKWRRRTSRLDATGLSNRAMWYWYKLRYRAIRQPHDPGELLWDEALNRKVAEMLEKGWLLDAELRPSDGLPAPASYTFTCAFDYWMKTLIDNRDVEDIRDRKGPDRKEFLSFEEVRQRHERDQSEKEHGEIGLAEDLPHGEQVFVKIRDDETGDETKPPEPAPPIPSIGGDSHSGRGQSDTDKWDRRISYDVAKTALELVVLTGRPIAGETAKNKTPEDQWPKRNNEILERQATTLLDIGKEIKRDPACWKSFCQRIDACLMQDPPPNRALRELLGHYPPNGIAIQPDRIDIRARHALVVRERMMKSAAVRLLIKRYGSVIRDPLEQIGKEGSIPRDEPSDFDRATGVLQPHVITRDDCSRATAAAVPTQYCVFDPNTSVAVEGSSRGDQLSDPMLCRCRFGLDDKDWGWFSGLVPLRQRRKKGSQ